MKRPTLADQDRTESLWNVDEVASLLSTSRGAVYKLVERKQIPHVRLGRKILFHPVKIRKWVEKHSVDAA